MDSDYRLKNLKESNRTEQINVPLLDWEKDVEPLLKSKVFDISSLNHPQRQMLCLPINLAMFLEINDPNFIFHSISNLHEKLIEKKQRIIAKERNPNWSLIQPLSAICDWMSQRQKLNAPVLVLDSYPNAADILASEGLIISFRGQVNFFHESFFDHIYARSFANHNKSLIELLTETEQPLFRRTQVRQILEALRQNDFDRYIQELSSVLLCVDIRFHLKVAICQWLSSVDNPVQQEFDVISQFDIPSDNFNYLFRSAVLSTHSWFDLLKKKSWIQKQIEDDENNERSEAVFRWLSNIAGKRPSEIANLLRKWWGGETKRAEKLLDWLGYVRRDNPDDDLIQLCEDVIKSKPINLFSDQGRDNIRMLLHTWIGKSPENCGGIIRSLYTVWFLTNPGENPFERGQQKTIAIHSFSELEKKAPIAFLEGTTDAIIQAIDMVVSEGSDGKNWYSFTNRTYSGHRFGFDKFIGFYKSALKTVLQEFPDTAIHYLDKFDANKHQTLMHIHLFAIQTNAKKLASRLPKLTTNQFVFDAGWSGADWLLFAQTCHEAFPYLEFAERNVIEQAILNHHPEINLGISVLKRIKEEGESDFRTKKRVIRNLNQSGHEQWCIFETIGEEMLGPVALSRLYQLRRKFPNGIIRKPRHMEAHSVTSPIKRAQCDRMNDYHWLSAISHYNNDEDRRYGHNFIDGGARQLAFELQAATKKDPTRFSNLCLKIPETAHLSYIQHILCALSETNAPSNDSLIQTIKHAHNHSEKPFGKDIARLLEKHPDLVSDPQILDMLIWYALNGQATENEESDENDTKRETITIDTLIQRGDRLHICGMNGCRGQAWEALGAVLWHNPKVEKQVWEAIETALMKEKLISVRCCMLNPLTPLFNMNKKRFSDSIKKLIVIPDDPLNKKNRSWLSPLITHTCIRLFPYIFYWLPELAKELVTELLESGDETTELIGAWIIFCESYKNDSYIEQADRLADLSIDHKRLLADVTSDSIKWTENRKHAEVLLKEFFFDEDKQIRQNAADCFSSVKPQEVESYRELSTFFLNSPAFVENGFSVLNMLKEATCDVVELVVDATKKIIADILKDRNMHGRRDDDIYQIQEILKREYPSSESNPTARKKILDVIDLMLFHEVYGVDSILIAHDRW